LLAFIVFMKGKIYSVIENTRIQFNKYLYFCYLRNIHEQKIVLNWTMKDFFCCCSFVSMSIKENWNEVKLFYIFYRSFNA